MSRSGSGSSSDFFQPPQMGVKLKAEITRQLGGADAPGLIALLESVGVGDNIQFIDRGISIPTSCVSNMEQFQIALSKLSKAGRAFPITVDGDQIQIDTFKMRAAEMRAAEMRVAEMRAAEMRAAKMHPVTLGIKEEDVIIPPLKRGSKVLDVGAGTGFLSEKMRNNAGCDVYALEPSFERPAGHVSASGLGEDFASCVSKLGEDHVEKLTLQDALAANPDKYFQAFDVVTVFKYNVPYDQKESFIAALAHVVKPGGMVYITSVEKEKFTFDPRFGDACYLTPTLQKYFGNIGFSTRKVGGGADQLMTCTAPRQELLQIPRTDKGLHF